MKVENQLIRDEAEADLSTLLSHFFTYLFHNDSVNLLVLPLARTTVLITAVNLVYFCCHSQSVYSFKHPVTKTVNNSLLHCIFLLSFYLGIISFPLFCSFICPLTFEPKIFPSFFMIRENVSKEKYVCVRGAIIGMEGHLKVNVLYVVEFLFLLAITLD